MRQHYIPRCYLKRFSDKGNNINAYDKTLNKRYYANMFSVCCEEDLYTLSDVYVKKCREEAHQDINNLTIEKQYFAKDVEPLYCRLLSDIDAIKKEWITGKESYRLSYVEKKELALHIATQYLRHPLIGEAEVNNYIRFEQASVDMMKHCMAKQSGNEELEKLKVSVSCEKPALHAQLTYMDYDELIKCAELMARNYYVFWISKDNDFYTSDFPIVVEPHVPNQGSLYCGLLTFGGELMMSLSPGLALSIYDCNYFNDKKELDCSFIVASDKEIRRHNMMRYFYAQRHVFSYKNDFNLVEFIYKIRGNHVFMKPNLDAEVVSGLGRY